jgi:hypothetical protein
MVEFLASRTGRWARILVGAGMVTAGLGSKTRMGHWMALAGLGPLLSGVLDIVPLAGVLGLPLKGAELRRKLGRIGEDSLLPPAPHLYPHRSELLH